MKEFEIGEDIYITDNVTGNDGEICEMLISSDYSDGYFSLFLKREIAEKVVTALQNILSQDDNAGGN